MAKAKTGALPGMERKGIAEIEKLADKYADLRDERMGVLKKEVEARTLLIDAMHKHGQKYYEFEDNGEKIVVELVVSGEKVKVRRKEEEVE